MSKMATRFDREYTWLPPEIFDCWYAQLLVNAVESLCQSNPHQSSRME